MLCRGNEQGLTYGAMHSEVKQANLPLMLAHALMWEYEWEHVWHISESMHASPHHANVYTVESHVVRVLKGRSSQHYPGTLVFPLTHPKDTCTLHLLRCLIHSNYASSFYNLSDSKGVSN